MKATYTHNKMNNANRAILAMCIAYLFFLAWAILWKCGAPHIGDGTVRAINLLLFKGNTEWELQFNIAVFVPLGFYLAACSKNPKFIKLIAATLLVSLALEALQFVLAIGRSDITDLLMNTLGGIIGIVAFYVVSKLSGKNKRKITLVLCILLTLIELYMTVSFIYFGQLNLGFMMIRLS